MSSRARTARFSRPSFAFSILCAFLILLWLAGGASRADAFGQIIVRTAAWSALVAFAFLGGRPMLGQAKPVALFVFCALVLVLLQLMPLPPGIWQSLSGREGMAGATQFSGQSDTWRPLALVPGAAWNAASSLVVPIVVLIALVGITSSEKAWLPGILLGLVIVSALVGLLQFSGAGFNNPFVNDTPGQVSGLFANRNHFALFLAIGCVLAPAWAFQDGQRPHWKAPVAAGIILLLTLTILASGSRAGMIVGMLGTGMGLLIASGSLRRELRRYPRWVGPLLLVIVIGTLAGFILLSVAVDRAESINRAMMAEGNEDMRTQALPVILALEKLYWPFGTGFGSFDPIFRTVEPNDLLKPTYFNHAHNDFLEVVLNGGVAGALLLIAAIGWWGIISLRVWRAGPGMARARTGSAILLLILVASLFDYPARTPLMMAIIVLAAVWLGEMGGASKRSALPVTDQPL